MSHSIVWRPKAVKDLDRIIDYIADKADPVTAASFGQELQAKTLKLADHPLMGRAGRPGLKPDWRELVVHKNYIVFYRVLAVGNQVEIMRLQHAAQQVA